MNAKLSTELNQAIAYADSLNPLLDAILNPKPRFDAAADRREDGLNEAREVIEQQKNKVDNGQETP